MRKAKSIRFAIYKKLGELGKQKYMEESSFWFLSRNKNIKMNPQISKAYGRIQIVYGGIEDEDYGTHLQT